MGYKHIVCALLFATVTGLTTAQNNTNSPYTRYGFGQLSDQSFGNSKAMGGIAYGLRNGSHINASNPASYTAIDSLTFLFEGGLSLQNTNISDGITKMNVKNSSFDYLAMQFRLNKSFAMSLGFLPFSNVGYNLNSSETVPDNSIPGNPQPSDRYTATHVFAGDGGLHQLFAGLGFKVFRNLSVGVNASYLFGNINRTVKTSFNTTNVYSNVQYSSIAIRDYKLDFGLQYTQDFGKNHHVTLGVIYSLKHRLNSEAFNYIQKTDQSNVVISESSTEIKDGFQLPHFFGGGFTYVYSNKLTVGFDYTLQKWSDARFYNTYNNLCDRSKYAFGVEYIPNATSRNYFGRMKYRAGAYYSDPYIMVENDKGVLEKGAREYGVSFGVGIPVFNSKSTLSVSGQYIKVSPKVKGLLDEQYLKLNIGLTFNERWFMKWKVQ